VKQKIKKFIERHWFESTTLQPKWNNQGGIKSILFSYRDFLIEKGKLKRKAKRKAKKEQRRKKQDKKEMHFAFAEMMTCNGL